MGFEPRVAQHPSQDPSHGPCCLLPTSCFAAVRVWVLFSPRECKSRGTGASTASALSPTPSPGACRKDEVNEDDNSQHVRRSRCCQAKGLAYILSLNPHSNSYRRPPYLCFIDEENETQRISQLTPGLTASKGQAEQSWSRESD